MNVPRGIFEQIDERAVEVRSFCVPRRGYREATTGLVSVPMPSYMHVPVSPPL